MLKKILCGAILSVSSVSHVSAEDAKWPTRTVTIVVGYSAGGTTDILARALAEELTAKTEKTFVVENRAGANSNIGAQYVARSKPDGYTLFMGSTANSINNSLYKNLNFDFKHDFSPVAKVGSVPNLLVVNSKSDIRSLEDYIKKAKEMPSELTCASSGIGSAIHMSCELFNVSAKVKIRHIPYKGSSNAMADLLGGYVDSIFDNMPTVAGNVRAGNLRGLAVTSAERSTEFPDIPTVSEIINVPYAVESWFGIFVPIGINTSILDEINENIRAVLESEEFQKKVSPIGAKIPSNEENNTDQFNEFVDEELEKWEELVTQLGLTVE